MVLVGYALRSRTQFSSSLPLRGTPYDYVVHVQNTFSIGYNPLVRGGIADRMALRALRKTMSGGTGLSEMTRSSPRSGG